MNWDGFPPSSPKRPPPASGIKVRSIGKTWWGRRWIAGLERISRDYLSRLGRGRSYARAGRVHALVIDGGTVTARVTGSDPRPYEVTLKVRALPDAAWRKALARMGARASFAAELLAGRMPPDIDKAFAAAGCSLFPTRQSDLETDCSCPDWANPCKHVAATHYVLGDAFDRDPWLLFELRGRSKTRVLETLTHLRSGDAGVRDRRSVTPPAGMTLDGLKAQDYEQLRAALPNLRLEFTQPTPAATILKPLGAPTGWSLEISPAELLEPVYRAASVRARRSAQAVDECDTGDTSAR
jgi:uncharacterized Zn finger protein